MNNVLVSVSIEGNLHTVREYCNARGLADYLVTCVCTGRYVSILFRVPADRALEVTEGL